MKAREANFDGLVGPTHHYAGLASGNKASQKHKHQQSNPRQAALQGLNKMKMLADKGWLQGVIPPHERPLLPVLRQLGFNGTDHQLLNQAARYDLSLLAAVSSASAMWTANMATVSPSADSADKRVHFTPANLQNKFHRSLEPPVSGRLLRSIFADERYFMHHDALPMHPDWGDEGAANHNRLGGMYEQPGVQLFVYGRDTSSNLAPLHYPARQTRAATEAVIRLHQLNPQRVLCIQQHPAAIDAGVFHNDVIAVTNQQVLFCHQRAFVDQPAVLAQLSQRVAAIDSELQVIEVPESQVSLNDVVQSYLFNSQLLTKPDGNMLLLLPKEAREHARVWDYIGEMLQAGYLIDEVDVCDLRESMCNGGGPACLRLRVVLTVAEEQAVNPHVWLNDHLFEQLQQWVMRHYRDRLCVADLADPQLLQEGYAALDQLTQLLHLGSIYDFQRN